MTAGSAVTTGGAVQHAHAVLHVNHNVAGLDAALAFHRDVGGSTEWMRQASVDHDATPMGLPASTASTAAFLYDGRGPRAAPSLELVQWDDPVTRPLTPPGPHTRGLVALGYRSAGEVGDDPDPAVQTCTVRGREVPVRRLTDPDGVAVELVRADPQAGDADDPAAVYFSHTRIGVADVAASVAWFAALGFVRLAEVETRPVAVAAADAGDERASIVLPDDPTFSLELERRTEAAPDRDAATQGPHRLALAVDDVAAAHEALRARDDLAGLAPPSFIPMPDVATGGFTVLFLTAPDGVVVELVERPRGELARPTGPVLGRYLPT